MATSKDLGAWAAAFVRQYGLETGSEAKGWAATDESVTDEPAMEHPAYRYVGVTLEASALLNSIDCGGIPAFITQNLLKIARDNGIEVGQETTPNDIIAALRQLASRGQGALGDEA